MFWGTHHLQSVWGHFCHILDSSEKGLNKARYFRELCFHDSQVIFCAQKKINFSDFPDFPEFVFFTNMWKSTFLIFLLLKNFIKLWQNASVFLDTHFDISVFDILRKKSDNKGPNKRPFRPQQKTVHAIQVWTRMQGVFALWWYWPWVWVWLFPCNLARGDKKTEAIYLRKKRSVEQTQEKKQPKRQYAHRST